MGKMTDWLTAVVGLAAITAIVTRPSGAQIIQAQAMGMQNMFKVMNAVKSRDPNIRDILGEMPDDVMEYQVSCLNQEDTDWLISMLNAGVIDDSLA